MIEPPTLSGDYKEDMASLMEFFNNLQTSINFDNLDGQEISSTTPLATISLVVKHKLDRIPTRFIVTAQDKAGSVIMTAADVKTVTIEGSVDSMAVTFFLQ